VSLASTLRAGFPGEGSSPTWGFLMLIYLAWVEIALLLFTVPGDEANAGTGGIRSEPIAYAAGLGL
jgi:hypothetical protein